MKTRRIGFMIATVGLFFAFASLAEAVTYAITPNPKTVTENAGSFAFTITRSGGTPAETIYASTTTTEGYSNGGDYTGIANQSVTFTSGQASKTVTVTINDDSTVESSETFGFIVQRNSSDPVSTYLAKSTFTITDNDVTPTTYAITPNPKTVSESVGSFTFTITRSGGTPAETIYASTTTTEGYSNGSDYTGIADQSVTFTSGQASKTVTVTINDDSTVETSETFGFIVQRNTSDPVSTYLAKSTFTITDNDVTPTTYAITPNPKTVSEDVGSFTYTITRSGGTPAETIYASTTTTEGDSNGSDYTGIADQSVTFTSGQASKTVTVTINDDSTVESSETFGFIVQRNTSDPVSTYLAKSTFTITDNDVTPTTYAITPNPATVSESVGTLTFTVTRSGGTPAETIYASTTTGEGSANNSDYTGIANQSVTFTSGQASRTVTVTINDDSTVESSETFGFIVQRNTSDPVTTYLAKSTFTITDNDVTPTTYAITPNPATVSEGAGTQIFTVTRSGGTPAETIYASTTTTEGFANNGDYATDVNNLAVAFTSGQASRTVTVTISDDSTVESSETFGFIVQRNTGDPVTTYLAKSTFTITDNDVTPTTYAITPNPATVGEAAGTLIFTITRSGGTPAETIYASTTTTEGFANNGDYATDVNNLAVAFTSGQASRTVTVTISDDSTVESSETFGFIVQRNTSDPVSTYLAKSTFTITDNDVTPTTYAITPNPATVSEGAGTQVFTITRSGGTPAETIYASTTTTEGFANNGDYATDVNNLAVAFTSGQASRTVTVTISDDSTVESSETFGFIVQRNSSDPVSTYLAKSTFTITDNDVTPTTYAITPNPATVGEAAGTLTFTIMRSGGTPAETIYASTTTTEGFANNGDYATDVNNLAVTFTSGQASRTVTVTILNNTTVENNETFGFIVQRNTSDPVTTYLAKSTFTITDNDVPPSFAVSNVRASQTPGTKLVEGYYDLTGIASPVAVKVLISTNGGTSYPITGAIYSAVSPGNNRPLSWDMSTAFNNKQSSQMRVKVTANSVSAESSTFAVDTRDNNRPVVQDITSTYADRLRRVYFIDDVTLLQEFTAIVDWNGKTPGTIRFETPTGTYTGTQIKRSFDVGSEFGVGGELRITAIAADGTASQTVRANFAVIPTPPGLLAQWFGHVPLATSLKYDTLKYTFRVQDSAPETVPDNIPWFGGHDLGFLSKAEGKAEIGGDGSASMSLSMGVGSETKMAGFKISPSITGRPEWHYNPETSAWQIGGYVGVELEADYKTPPYYLPVVVPIFFRADVKVDNSVLFGIRGWNVDNTPQLSGLWDFKGQVKGVVGCGASGFLAAEGYLGGGPVWTIEYQPAPTWQKLGVELNGGFRVVALFWVYDNQLLHYEWYKYGGPSQLSQSASLRVVTDQLNKPDARAFAMLNRDYASRSKALRGLASKNMGLMSLNSSGEVLQSDVYPYSEPSLSIVGTNQFLVWISDNPARSDENRTDLVWSKWNGTAWASATSVWNEGTADFAPSLAAFPNGSALVVWQNEKASLTNGANLDEALAGLEIGFSRYDSIAGGWVSTNLTDNQYIDRSPQLAAATNGAALLTWISNPSNDVNGSVLNCNRILYRRWNGTAWSVAGSITTNARMLLWHTLAFNGTNGVLVAAIDGDDDQGTIEDQELYGAVYTGSTWTAFARLTTNTVQDTKPQTAYDTAGNLVVTWYQGSNLVLHSGSLVLGSPSVVGEVGGSSSAKDFTLVMGPAGQISMIWVDIAEDGSGPDPFMFNYDLTLNAWSKPIRLMENTNLLERSFAPAYAPDGAIRIAYNQVHIQTDTNGFPLFTNNVVDFVFADYSIGGDLGIQPGDISLSVTNLVPGQTVDVIAVVRNLGEIAATNIAVAFYEGHPAEGGSRIGNTQMVAQILAGGVTNSRVNWMVPLILSNSMLHVVVDPALVQEDRNRANNTATMAALSPDLTISEMSVLHSATNRRMLNARVLNAGLLTSGNSFDVSFRRGTTNGTLLATAPIDALPSAGQFDANFEWNLSGLTFTSAFETVYAIIDPTIQVAEVDRANNLGMVQVMTLLDSDGDGLLDGEEIQFGSSSGVQDSDGDGIGDGSEVHTYGTSPIMADSDGDGARDGDELRAGTDPSSKADVFAIVTTDQQTGLSLVSWSAKSNKTYQVIKSLELSTWTNAPSGAGIDQQSQATAVTNGLLQYIDPESSTNGRAFYRVNLAE